MFALTKSYNYWYQRSDLSLEDELYDELSGRDRDDDLRKALKLYYEELVLEAAARPANSFFPVDRPLHQQRRRPATANVHGDEFGSKVTRC